MTKMMAARLFVCQGPTPLLTLLSVIEQRRRDEGTEDFYDVLVISGLYAATTDEWDLARFIERVARAAHRFNRIYFLCQAEVEELARRYERGDRRMVAEHLRQRLGVELFDEIYLTRTWLWSNRLLVHTYPDAERIGVGDGVGFHFTRDYAAPEGRRANAYFDDSSMPPAPLQRGYLLLPQVFGNEANFPTTRLRAEVYFSVLDSLSAFHSVSSDENEADVLLLTSNLSESGRVSPDREVAAYLDFIDSLAISAESSLWIKGHPRDRGDKLEAVASRLRKRFRQVNLLDREARFSPLELYAYPRLRESARKLRIVTAGSTCLPLTYLFSRTADVGFGASLVEKYFNPEHVRGRCRFESDLRSLTASLLKQFGGVAG